MSRRKNQRIINIVTLILVFDVFILGFLIIKAGISHAKVIEFQRKQFAVLETNKFLNKYTIKFDAVDGADTYVVQLIHDNVIINSWEVKDTTAEVELPRDNLINGNKYIVNIIAYKEGNILKSIDKNLEITWEEPSFSLDNSKDIKNKDYVVKLDGKVNDDYRIIVMANNSILYDKDIGSNIIAIPEQLYKDKNIKLDFWLYSKEGAISNFSAQNAVEINPITDFLITKPKEYINLTNLSDLKIEYTGGDNATSKRIYIYENNKLIKDKAINGKPYVIRAKDFKKNTRYNVKIVAKKGKFQKSDSLFISTANNTRTKMVDLASNEIGNEGGEKYWRWWGYDERVEWCAIFISWLADQNKLTKVIPKFQAVDEGIRLFKEKKHYKSNKDKYIPQSGDIIFFDWGANNIPDHVGLVEYVDGEYVYTIEGNSRDVCRRKQYELGAKEIYGYGTYS